MSDRLKRRAQRRIHFRRCIILGCGLTSRNAGRDVSFHTLPKATLGWVRTNCAQYLPTGVNLCRVFICSRHYHPSYVNVTPAPGGRRLLTTNAIPTIFPPFSCEKSQVAHRSQESASRKKVPADESSNSTASDDLESTIIPPLTAGPVSISVSEASSSSCSSSSSDSSEKSTEQTTPLTKKTNKSHPLLSTSSPPVIDKLCLAIESISLQCDRVASVLEKLDPRRIPIELLIPLRDLVKTIQSTSERKQSSVEASIEIFENDIRISEELLQPHAGGYHAPTSTDAEDIPIEIHMTTDMCCEGINFRHHRLN